jgi:hypothetical protein
MQPPDIDPAPLSAIDVHVHLEAVETSDTDAAARDYFGDSGAPRDPDGLAEYYRSRRMAFVVFTVDERLSGRRHVSNDDVLGFAATHADVAMPFISVDPTRGPDAIREAKRLLATGLVRGLKLHPPLQQFFANDRVAYPLYELFAEARLPVLFHTGHSGIGTGVPGGGGIRLKYGAPDAHRRCGGRFSGAADRDGASVVSVARRGNLDLLAQADGLHRPVGMVPEVFRPDAGSVRELAAEAKGAVRIRLPVDHAGSLVGRFREDWNQGRGPAADPEGECRAAVRIAGWFFRLKAEATRGLSSTLSVNPDFRP